MQKYRNFSLDFIRSISVLLIIFFHYNCATVRIVSKDLMLFKYYGYTANLGVSMFFILSGASLALSTRNNPSVINFYQKRFMAIFPLFWTIYFLIAFAITITLRSNPFVGRNPMTFLLTIFGLDGFLLYKIPNYYLIGEWFLGCIIILYVLFPVFKYLFYRNKHLLLLVSFVFCIFLEKVYSLNMPLLRFPLFRIFELIFGMYFVTVCNNNSHKQNYVLLSIASISIAAIFVFKLHGNLLFSNIIFGTLSFIFLATLSSIFQNYIPKKFICFLSKYSYAAFLLHHFILIKIVYYAKDYFFLPQNNAAIFFTTLFIVYLLSYVICYFFKKFNSSISLIIKKLSKLKSSSLGNADFSCVQSYKSETKR